MDVLYERCCGLDIHKDTVVACLIVPGSTGKPTTEMRRFGTMTDDLLQLTDWLVTNGVTHIDFLDAAITEVSAEITERLRPFEEELERLATIPGVGRRTAEVLVAEIGTDMGRCPTSAHLT